MGMLIDLDLVNTCLSHAIKNLWILHEQVERELMAQQNKNQHFYSAYCLNVCEAMYLPMRELEQIHQEIDDLLQTEIQREKGQ